MSLSKLGERLRKEGLAKDEADIAPTSYLNTGFPPLNECITGNPDLGLPCGRPVMIAGPSASGKTMIATQLMISAQRQNGFAMFYDHEHAYHGNLAIKQGLLTDEDHFLYMDGVSFEQSIKHCFVTAQLIRDENLLDKDAPIVAIFDSIAAMTPMKKLEKDIDELTMNDSTMLARVTSQLFPIIVQKCKEHNITMVFINQTRDSMSMYGPSTTTPGGKAPYYYCSTVIYLSGSSIFLPPTGKDRKLMGKEVTAKIEKCRTRAPGRVCNWNFLFKEDGTGFFDVIGSYAEYLKNIGAIKSVGPRVEWDGGKPFMSQVKEQLYKDENALEKLKTIHHDFLAESAGKSER